jgi:hypothetical protein
MTARLTLLALSGEKLRRVSDDRDAIKRVLDAFIPLSGRTSDEA